MTTFLDVLKEHGVRTAGHDESPHVSQGWVGIICPWCGTGTGKFGLGFNPGTGALKCWKCGPHRWADALAELTGRSLKECIDALRGIERPWRGPPTAHKGVYKPPKGLQALAGVHRRYLTRRGFDTAVLERLWGLQGTGQFSTLPWRVFIPIRDIGGQAVSWTTRSLRDEGVRYVGARPEEEGVPRRSLLYGEEMAGNSILVVEGPADVWAVGPGAVATMGIAWSKEQASRIGRYPLRVICFDADDADMIQARRLHRFLSAWPGTTLIWQLETGKDPASADKKEIRHLRRKYLK